MAYVFQMDRKDTYAVLPHADLFIRMENGEAVRIGVERDGIHILPINGVTFAITYRKEKPGVKFKTWFKKTWNCVQVFQPRRRETYTIAPGQDALIHCDNGGDILVLFEEDGIVILPTDDVTLDVCSRSGCAGFKFSVAPPRNR